jgi:hypothetical protein
VFNIYFIAALLTALTGVCAIIGYLLKQHRNSIKSIVDESVRDAIAPLDKRLDDTISPIDKRLAVIETKMELFWQRIAIDMAKTLHHPEPSRVRVDALLDNFMSGHLNDADSDELRGYLEVIRDWEPGQIAPFMIFQGEQVAAAILLHTMEHVTNQEMRKADGQDHR